jgi:hypothetical protein
MGGADGSAAQSVSLLDVVDGKIARVYIVANPEKLPHVSVFSPKITTEVLAAPPDAIRSVTTARLRGSPAMTATSHRDSRSRQAASVVAGGLVAVLGVAAIASSGGGAAGASTSYTTHASGRYLSGTIGGNSLDTIAGIEGETATNPHGGSRVVHRNSLNAEVLDGATEVPLQNGLQLPGQGVLHLGAVAQYAEADPTGEAIGAAGAIADNGGIGVGGTKGAPSDATLDLSGLGGKNLASLLNLKATIGAISAHAHQASGGHGKQTGNYEIAGLRLELDLPKLADLLKPVLTTVQPLLDTLTTEINNLGNLLPPGAVTVSFPSLSHVLDSLTDVSLLNGGVVVDLKHGKIIVDVEKILQAVGLDLNNLPPNTSLLPYVVDALTKAVPKAISDLASSLVDTITTQVIDEITVTVAGVDVTGSNSNVANLISTLAGSLGGALSTVLTGLDTFSDQLGPVFAVLNKILEIIVNGQSTSHGVFTEQALLLSIGNGTGFTLPPLGIPPTSNARIRTAQAQIRAKARQEKADAQPTGRSSGTPSGGESPNGAGHTRLSSHVQAHTVAAVRSRTVAAAPVNSVVSLALATATVGPSAPVAAPTPSSSAPPTVPSTNVPVGVPAGAGTHGENLTLPLVLVLLGLVLAGGGAYAYRGRGRFGA